MSMRLNPYFTLNGTAREAFEFYQSIFGGELVISTFENFDAPIEPEHKHLVMHGELQAEHFTLQVSDVAAIYKPENNATTNMEVALLAQNSDLETVRGWFDQLTDGASKLMPLNTAPWGATFGSLTDKFGIAWMFNVEG